MKPESGRQRTPKDADLSSGKRVVIVCKSLPAYRRDFFNSLHASLADEGVRLDLVYGDAIGADRSKRDSITLPWATYRRNRSITILGRHLVWQPISHDLRGADLVVVEQASKLLINYWLLLRQVFGGRPRVALWGHGANMQTHTRSAISEAVKRRYSRLAHWWFAYTEGSRRRVAELGYPTERITVVQNAIDTRKLAESTLGVTEAQLTAFRVETGCASGATALFIGGLYDEKRLPFLIEAAVAIQTIRPDFVLLVGGDGPQRELVRRAEARHDCVRYLGRLDGDRRHVALRAADVILMPGLVGLAIVDAFAAEAPIITTNVDYHSPEFEYLEQNTNGMCIADATSVAAYANAVCDLLGDPERLALLRRGCRNSAAAITNEEMVRRFREGIFQALGLAAPQN